MNIPSKTDDTKLTSSFQTGISSREILLYSLVLILALFLRLYNLGAAPLSDYEAGFALDALQAANPEGATAEFGSQMAYVALTSPLFFLLKSSNFLARLWPALAGTLLVCLPILLRRRLGRGIALILAFGLAIDPGMVVTSRLAGGTMLALAFSLLALALWDNQRFILAGIAGGLALLSGPATINGWIFLALTWAILRLARQPFWPKLDSADTPPVVEDLPTLPYRTAWRNTAISAAITVVLAGTLFFRYPQGIAAWAGTLPDYLSGWVNSTGTPSGLLLLALLVYQPGAILLAVTGIAVWLIQKLFPAAEDNRLEDEENPEEENPTSARSIPYKPVKTPPWFALLWAGLGLMVTMIYPGRQVIDLVWVLAPIWLLAAWTLHTHLLSPLDWQHRRFHPASLAHSGLLLVLCSLFWLTLIATRLVEPVPGMSWPVVRAGVILVVLVLGGLISALISMGWSWQVGRDGLVWGLGVALLIYNTSALWGATQLRTNMPEELWGPPPAAVQVDLFSQTLVGLSKWQTGLPGTLDIVSLVDTPALRWVLRDFPQTSYLSAPEPSKRPSVVITAQDESAPELAASYRGQDFLWSSWRGWSGSLPPDFISWLAFRKAPQQNAHIILWMRADLKPAGGLLELPAGDSTIIPEEDMPPYKEQAP